MPPLCKLGDGCSGMRIGVISDTHGLLRPEAVAALAGSDMILHAGDVGDPAVLEGLRAIAPVKAVRGNVDTEAWALSLPLTERVQVEGKVLYLLHNAHHLRVDPAAAGLHMVICGHTHRPMIREENGVVLLNPGSAGPRRFRLPVSVARIHATADALRAELISLNF
jgi:phosphoesterase, MJ0936 family